MLAEETLRCERFNLLALPHMMEFPYAPVLRSRITSTNIQVPRWRKRGNPHGYRSFDRYRIQSNPRGF
jgi:hypothetical protein